MKSTFCFEISRVRLFLGEEISKIFILPIGFYVCAPFLGFMSRCRGDTKKSRSIMTFCPALVLSILRCSSFAQINNSIIGAISIPMIQSCYPFAKYIKPSQPMGSVQSTVDGDNNIAGWLQCSGKPSSASGGPASRHDPSSPYKNPSLRIVMKQLFELFLGKITSSHFRISPAKLVRGHWAFARPLTPAVYHGR